MKHQSREHAEAQRGELMWTIKDVSTALQVSERTVWRMAVTGRFPPGIRIGRAVRWRALSVLDWISRKEAAARKQQATFEKPT